MMLPVWWIKTNINVIMLFSPAYLMPAAENLKDDRQFYLVSGEIMLHAIMATTQRHVCGQ